MADKHLEGDDPAAFIEQIEERAKGHAPGYSIVIYARPSQWAALAQYVKNLRAELRGWTRSPYAPLKSRSERETQR